jgi:hypothetical protein
MIAKSVLLLILFSSPVLAVNKCVENGKTVYQQSPCVNNTDKPLGSVSVSSVSSQGLRDSISAQQAAAAEAERQRQDVLKQALSFPQPPQQIDDSDNGMADNQSRIDGAGNGSRADRFNQQNRARFGSNH